MQRNQLPKLAQWQHKLRDLAIDWQPKDIIGGDIWWMSGAASDGPISIALIDCTGRGEAYVDQGQQHYEEQQRQRSIAALKRRAAALGFAAVTPTPVPA